MKSRCRLSSVLLVSAALVACSLAPAQENVTVSKSRLEELERKEAELEKLKGELKQAGTEKAQLQRENAKANKEKQELQKAKDAAEARALAVKPVAQPPAIAHDIPGISTLPALAAGQVVDALDLMNHYRAEPAAAAKRYEAGRIRLTGEVVSFDKPMLVQYGVIALKTTEAGWRVACRVEPPANLSTLFTAKNGDELVGAASSGARSVLARVGQRVVVEGWCKGLKDQGVTLTSATLIRAE